MTVPEAITVEPLDGPATARFKPAFRLVYAEVFAEEPYNAPRLGRAGLSPFPRRMGKTRIGYLQGYGDAERPAVSRVSANVRVHG
ncbi:hypothetical protein ACTPOK_16670 [Streptomyces inhibens]|uniref:hypothetical protein n=1 Tax=Streptomyces inhibens TaxID=2293571 RepID=UPI00402A6803